MPAQDQTSPVGTPPRERLASVDVLRGIVMIIMALDHVRDYFGFVRVNPVDPATTTAALFFTRWITHLCAPTFFLLTGTGAGLSRQRSGDVAGLARHLVVRGAWLLVLEVVVLRSFGMQFNLDYRVTGLTVLWALGWAMIALGAMVRFEVRTILLTGLVLIAGHNLLDPVPPATFGALAPLWHWLHVPGLLVASERVTVFVAYPVIPWIGVTMVGYALAEVYRWDADRRRRLLVQAGAALVAAFVVLRAANLYGDPSRWSVQPLPGHTLLSFLNTTKYPPSLLFLLMTLGPALLLLATLDGVRPGRRAPAWVFGQVPMFYFLVHFTLIHLLAVVVCYARLGSAHWFFESPTLADYPYAQPPGWGFGLPVVWGTWIGVVVLMYPLCLWYAGVKRRHPGGWLRYL